MNLAAIATSKVVHQRRRACSTWALSRTPNVLHRRPNTAAAQEQKRFHHPDPFNPKTTRGWKAALKESTIPTTKFDHEIAQGLIHGLPGASSITDKTIPTFSRGELPHFAGINTFLKAPYIEDSRNVGNYDVAVVGVPFDGGCTYRAGTRFGPQGIRRISALYTPYNYEKGIDLREQMVRRMGGARDSCPCFLITCFLVFSERTQKHSSTLLSLLYHRHCAILVMFLLSPPTLKRVLIKSPMLWLILPRMVPCPSYWEGKIC